jgi:hypothetical protein
MVKDEEAHWANKEQSGQNNDFKPLFMNCFSASALMNKQAPILLHTKYYFQATDVKRGA